MTMELKLIDGFNFSRSDYPFLDAFQHYIYEPAFPNPDEREPFEFIIERVKSCGDVRSIIVLGLEGREVCAGLVADWYEECRCLELVYIAVEPKHCRKGFGRQIFNDGTWMMLESVETDSLKVAHVFAEVENPNITQEAVGIIDPKSRLRFFAILGARWIPISYVQPPLSKGRDYADNMLLICFPAFTSSPLDCMPADELASFLNAFYDELREF